MMRHKIQIVGKSGGENTRCGLLGAREIFLEKSLKIHEKFHEKQQKNT
jgi:hypothetical protein